MTSKYRRGFDITRDSLRVFTQEPSLVILPVLSLLAVGSAFAVLAAIALQQGLVASLVTNDLYQYGAMFCAIAISSSVATFFNAAVVHCAAQLFDGNPTSVRDGLAAAWRARRQIAVWAVVAATLGTVLYILDEKFGVVGSLTRAVFNLAWALLTFFIVPVIVLDQRRSLRRQLRRSGSLFRETWGESVSATLGVSFTFLIVALPGVVLAALGYFSLDGVLATGALVGGGGIVVAAIVGSQTASAIVRTALYRYATTGEQVGPFEEREPDALW
ncbi:DUF6159 family protein [Halopenitus persicus]|uniref:Uncharacterized protein n=1 Tax=Halopenitus persicus TaxID=1048396 RepID=A0A1H3JHK5_9EURY|nr:DUF6159 family protein [Halopenitus persicus]SDY39059.1 hypothetical protein SAMN05216564_1052 [Halopenitus persicus]